MSYLPGKANKLSVVVALLVGLSVPVIFNQCAAQTSVAPEDLSSMNFDGPRLSADKYSLSIAQTAQISVSGGTPPYTFTVTPANLGTVDNSSQVFTAAANGIASIKATDNDGKVSDPIAINVDPGAGGQFGNSVDFPLALTGTLWSVPAGVTVIRVKAWGAGGGSGNTPSSIYGAGGGGAGGYAQADITVTPGEILTIHIGAPGTGSNTFYSAAYGRGGSGGGYTAVFRNTTALLVAGAGGGGGAGGSAIAGGQGGLGGGGNGVGGGTCLGSYGRGGTQVAGGLASTGCGAGTTIGVVAGSALKGGNGVTPVAAAPVGGAIGGGNAGAVAAGGGAGWFGGGSGSYGTNGGGGGGGGGSNMLSGVNKVDLMGTGVTPPNTADPDYMAGAGTGGAGGIVGTGNSGGPGFITILY